MDVNTYIQLLTEYGYPALCLWLKTDVALLQKICNRATKMVEGLQNQSYADRLGRMDVFDFGYCQLRDDCVLVYMILNANGHHHRTTVQSLSHSNHSYSFIFPGSDLITPKLLEIFLHSSCMLCMALGQSESNSRSSTFLRPGGERTSAFLNNLTYQELVLRNHNRREFG